MVNNTKTIYSFYFTATTTLATVFPVRLCKPHEFACKNGRRCVPKTALCDNWLDCSDGSDEYICGKYCKGFIFSPEGIRLYTNCAIELTALLEISHKR